MPALGWQLQASPLHDRRVATNSRTPPGSFRIGSRRGSRICKRQRNGESGARPRENVTSYDAVGAFRECRYDSHRLPLKLQLDSANCCFNAGLNLLEVGQYAMSGDADSNQRWFPTLTIV